MTKDLPQGATSDTKPYMELVAHYESCLAAHGPTHLGVDWPNEADLKTRFNVMLGVVKGQKRGDTHPSLLDLGCGPGLLLDHISASTNGPSVVYQGVDISQAMIDAAISRHPHARFSTRDVLTTPLPAQSVDYVVMNGVLTERRSLTFKEMEAFATQMIACAYAVARVGIAFNVMSPFVDWEREDLFHWPIERMMAAALPLSRHVRIRADYGLREYTTYIYRHAQQD